MSSTFVDCKIGVNACNSECLVCLVNVSTDVFTYSEDSCYVCHHAVPYPAFDDVKGRLKVRAGWVTLKITIPKQNSLFSKMSVIRALLSSKMCFCMFCFLKWCYILRILMWMLLVWNLTLYVCIPPPFEETVITDFLCLHFMFSQEHSLPVWPLLKTWAVTSPLRFLAESMQPPWHGVLALSSCWVLDSVSFP